MNHVSLHNNHVITSTKVELRHSKPRSNFVNQGLSRKTILYEAIDFIVK